MYISYYVEYNPNANVDDGSCSVISLICTDEIHVIIIQTQIQMMVHVMFIQYAGYDCEGQIVDSDGDGVCDEFEIVGCQDELLLIMIQTAKILDQTVVIFAHH